MTQAQNETEHTFEIGLVVAGAASGGAYEAGVLDYLVEALDNWYAAKAKHEDVPKHNVKLKTVVGTSAGGMNSAILSIALHWGYQPRHLIDKDNPKECLPSVWCESEENTKCPPSPFYATWVEAIDITKLLKTSDIEQEHEVYSLLDSNCLHSILHEALDFKGVPLAEKHTYRDWVADPLLLNLTTTNLTGVPYKISFEGGESIADQTETMDDYYYMALHKDFMSFSLQGINTENNKSTGNTPPGYIDITYPNSGAVPKWQLLGDTAIATGAFPVGLAPMELCRSYTNYDCRISYSNLEGETQCVPPATLPKDYEQQIQNNKCYEQLSDKYAFVNVDGGVMDNEPFNIAIKMLYGDDCQEKMGEDTKRAILLIEAFPTHEKLGITTKPSILGNIMAMLNAQIAQARFKIKDLKLAADKKVRSRYVIQPHRYDAQGKKLNLMPLASAPLYAFFGFFCQAYREHDFQLGRQNCQHFLRNTFTLPADHALFKEEKDSPIAHKFSAESGERQIIPLVGNCAKDEPSPTWPSDIFKLDSGLEKDIKARLNKIAACWIKKYIPWGYQWIGSLGWYGTWVYSGVNNHVFKWVFAKISDAIQKVDNAK